MRNLAAFALMSLIWGLTWAAIRIGLTAPPPLFLAALRYLIAAVLLGFTVRGAGAAFTAGRTGQTIASALLVNAGTHGLLFWGMQHVASGLAGLVNLALIPVLLFALAAFTGEERPGWRHALALVTGCAGLGEGGGDILGLTAVVAATACYCVGSVIARPLALTLAQATIGGTALLALSLVTEPVTLAMLAAVTDPRILASLLFLSVVGTIVAYTLYLVLIRDWGTVRAGLYAFVSPIIALAAGATLFGEPIGWTEIAGALLLFAAAAFALSRPRESKPRREISAPCR